MSDVLRIGLFLLSAVVAAPLLLWVAGRVAVRLGYPKAVGRRVAAQAFATGGLSLLTEPAPKKPLIPVSKKDERLAAVEPPRPGNRSRPSGLSRRAYAPTRLDERD